MITTHIVHQEKMVVCCHTLLFMLYVFSISQVQTMGIWDIVHSSVVSFSSSSQETKKVHETQWRHLEILANLHLKARHGWILSPEGVRQSFPLVLQHKVKESEHIASFSRLNITLEICALCVDLCLPMFEAKFVGGSFCSPMLKRTQNSSF